jgi:hypothetical protein
LWVDYSTDSLEVDTPLPAAAHSARGASSPGAGATSGRVWNVNTAR